MSSVHPVDFDLSSARHSQANQEEECVLCRAWLYQRGVVIKVEALTGCTREAWLSR